VEDGHAKRCSDIGYVVLVPPRKKSRKIDDLSQPIRPAPVPSADRIWQVFRKSSRPGGRISWQRHSMPSRP